MVRALCIPTSVPMTIAIERMEPRANRKEAWDSLVDLAVISGGFGYMMGDVIWVRPSLWTGKRNKEANHRRIRARLEAEETSALELGLENCPTRNHKELLDAVGIGLYTLRRL